MDTSGPIGEKKKTEEIGMKVRRKTKEKPYLPDDIIPNILCRLPAKNVMRCRLVCKAWRDLTLNCDFLKLHSRHSVPMILVANCRPRNATTDCVILDKWWELPARSKLVIHKFQFDSDRVRALYSHAGLVVFRNCYVRGTWVTNVIVGNPMDSENVRVIINLSKEIMYSKIYGVFFHPSLKEYCSLWMIRQESSSHPEWIKYKILTLGSNPSMKTISNPFSHRFKRRRSPPLFIDKYLYWMLVSEIDESKYCGRSDIMQFDIIREEFTVMPCPVPLDDTGFSSDNTKLLNIDGILSFLFILPRKITIWRLADHAQQQWTTSTYTFSIKLYPDIEVPEAIAVVEGKLAVLSNGRLIVYDLMQGTMYCRKTQYSNAIFLSHRMSFASLTNCTSKIFIDQEGEVARKVSNS